MECRQGQWNQTMLKWYLEGANECITDELLGIEHLDLYNLVKDLLRTLLEVEVDDLVGGSGRG